MTCHVLLALGVLATAGMFEDLSAEERTLVEILKDAQAANEARLRAGKLSARVRFVRQRGYEPIEMLSDVTWDGKKTFWEFRIRDPKGRYWGGGSDDRAVELQPIQYMMRTENEIYMYNFKTNHVFFEKDENFNLTIFEIAPLVFWTGFQSSFLETGRRWSEMIGPHPRFAQSRFSLERVGADRIKQVRRDERGGVLTLLFSLADSGNVVEARYEGVGNDRSISRTFTWGKTDDGVSVLKECAFTTSVEGRPNLNEVEFNMEISKIQLFKSLAPSTFSERALLAKLPKDYTFVNQITGKSYRASATKSEGPDQRLKALADRLRSSGFLAR